MKEALRRIAERNVFHAGMGYFTSRPRWLLFAGLLVLGWTGFPSGVFGQVPPVNDNFVNAIQLIGTNVVATGSNINATKEAGEPDHAGNSGGKSVWWYWQAPAVGYVTISTLGSVSSVYGGPLDTILGVYTGSAVANLSEVASNDDGPIDATSQVNFKTSAGTVYRIAVDGYSYDIPEDADCGSIELSLQFIPGLPSAPSWSLPTLDGSEVSSTNFAGKVVVLNFWATWCGPCVAEIPALIALQQMYAPDGLTVVGLSLDDSTDGINPPYSLLNSFASSYGINYPVVMDRPDAYEVEYLYGGINYIPTTFIIDRQNHIAQSFVGSQNYSTYESAVLPLIYANLTVNLAMVNGSAHLSWPVTQASFLVESTGDLSSGVWTASSATVQSDGVNSYVDIPLGPTTQFFRLHQQ